jgi:hypothetical protein
VEQLDFEFVLFASTVVDYDYIMTLIANYTTQEPSKQTMTKVTNMFNNSRTMNIKYQRNIFSP